MEQTECSETLAYKIQTPGNYPEDSIQHSEHGKSLKWSIIFFSLLFITRSKLCLPNTTFFSSLALYNCTSSTGTHTIMATTPYGRKQLGGTGTHDSHHI